MVTQIIFFAENRLHFPKQTKLNEARYTGIYHSRSAQCLVSNRKQAAGFSHLLQNVPLPQVTWPLGNATAGLRMAVKKITSG